jgi:hypothetical protein
VNRALAVYDALQLWVLEQDRGCAFVNARRASRGHSVGVPHEDDFGPDAEVLRAALEQVSRLDHPGFLAHRRCTTHDSRCSRVSAARSGLGRIC